MLPQLDFHYLTSSLRVQHNTQIVRIRFPCKVLIHIDAAASLIIGCLIACLVPFHTHIPFNHFSFGGRYWLRWKESIGVEMTLGPSFVAAALLLSTYLVTMRHRNPDEGYVMNQKLLKREYDFVIVGGGSAGAALAGRLSEVPQWTVLLLEAGTEENELSEPPGFSLILPTTPMDWHYTVEPNSSFCQGLRGKICHWSSGRSLGGTGALNYMLYVRGNRRDFDTWEAMGNPGWGYKDVLPYFIKSEDNQNPQYVAEGFHGSGGPLTVAESSFKTPLGEAFLQAASEMGYQVRDGNGEFQSAFMTAQGTIRNGARCTSNKAYLRPARNRPNLHVAQRAMVEKVLLDPKTRRARGVQFWRDQRRQTVEAKTEVILSAGALRTPQLLMLSGIGPAGHLKQFGIRSLVDAPGVGENLMDHISTGGVMFLIDQKISANVDRHLTLDTFHEWIRNRTGPLTSLGGVEGLAWVKTKYADPNDDYPDIQFHFAAGSILSDRGQVRSAQALSDDIWNEIYRDNLGKDAWMVLPMILRPLSRGQVKLRSADVRDQPRFYPNYLSHERDLRVLIEGVRQAIALSQTTPFQRLNSTFYPRPLPPCKHLTFLSDEYLECHLRHYTVTEHHFSGTARMGSDPMAVVDTSLRVRGVPGLRVVDASVMPTVTSGNINAVVVMIAEKAADIIKRDLLSTS